MSSSDAAKQENREAMPESAAIVKELREVFGKLPRGWFEENGRRVEWGTSTTKGR
jgi:hypothetical protein